MRGSMYYKLGGGESLLCISKLTSVFHRLPSVGPKQLCAFATKLVCIKIFIKESYIWL